MKVDIENTFENPEIPSVKKATTGVNCVVTYLNHYQKSLRNNEFHTIDAGFLKVQVNKTLEIGKRFWDVTEKSTEINLQMAGYAGRVSHHINYIIDNNISGEKFSKAMKKLLENAKRIHGETLEIKIAYNEISQDLQKIHSECELRNEELGHEKKKLEYRALDKARKENKSERRAIFASVATGVSAVVFPPAAAFFGGMAAIGTYNAKKYGKRAVEAREKGDELQNSMDSIDCFQSVIKDIRNIVDLLEAFWKDQVNNVQELVNSAKDCQDDVEMEPIEADRIVGQWKNVEDQFREYNSEISKELKKDEDVVTGVVTGKARIYRTNHRRVVRDSIGGVVGSNASTGVTFTDFALSEKNEKLDGTVLE
ncbi:10217_t:CDS:2 [Funneliformis geosporum]|uniref:10217_t:CDS:1 n=1 Tax=Funneliformis geosporum TaxID=1117311 RepID=A0A9W4WU79_9GLOM|nr:10217_t:CDS:2 [Funneliformis geosporum]